MQPRVPADLLASIRMGDRFALSRGITILESTLASDRIQAQALMEKAVAYTGKASRIAITGSPGVGKSTLIEALGMLAIEHGHRVAVLAIDPSSKRSGGSILGDKTRMPLLSRETDAYIRPSPSAGVYGGIGLTTYESSLLCEAAGFDFILIETVGVGQSEIEAGYAADLLLLLLQPGAGDDLQGIKRGIVEMAQMLIVTKADGQLKNTALRTRLQYHLATGGSIPTLSCSAIEKRGLKEIWDGIQRLLSGLNRKQLQTDREGFWFMEKAKRAMLEHMLQKESELLTQLEAKVRSGKVHYLKAIGTIMEKLQHQ